MYKCLAKDLDVDLRMYKSAWIEDSLAKMRKVLRDKAQKKHADIYATALIFLVALFVFVRGHTLFR